MAATVKQLESHFFYAFPNTKYGSVNSICTTYSLILLSFNSSLFLTAYQNRKEASVTVAPFFVWHVRLRPSEQIRVARN
jgi:hypothetical protein